MSELLRKFQIPVTYEMCGIVEIAGTSLSDAIAKVLLDEGEPKFVHESYVEGSMTVNMQQLAVAHPPLKTLTKGTRVKLLYMSDEPQMNAGATGTVQHVDSINQVHVAWDTGGSLALVPGVDVFEIIQEGEDI